jgi:hypothetical protein
VGFAPISPNNVSSNLNDVLIDVIETDYQVWQYRQARGQDANFNEWVGTAISTYTQSPTPPTIPQYPLRVIRTGFVSDWEGGGAIELGTGWTYASTGCAPVDEPQPPTPPKRDTNPNNPDIPNTIEASISLDAANQPIAYIQHSPSCLLGGWGYAKSFRIVSGAVKSYQGKLTTDWRYGDPFDCRDTWQGDNYANLDKLGKIWTIPTNDRPATLAPNVTTPSKITPGRIDSGNCGTPINSADKSVQIRIGGFSTLTIVGMAAAIKKRR